MKFYKAKYLKNNAPTGRSYTFKSEEFLWPGNKAETPDGKHVQIVDEPIDMDMDWVETHGVDKVVVIKKYEDVGSES